MSKQMRIFSHPIDDPRDHVLCFDVEVRAIRGDIYEIHKTKESNSSLYSTLHKYHLCTPLYTINMTINGKDYCINNEDEYKAACKLVHLYGLPDL